MRAIQRVRDEASEAPSAQAFHIEWQPEQPGGLRRHFCLRWLRDMRIVEAVGGDGGGDAHMLRLANRYACDGFTAGAFDFLSPASDRVRRLAAWEYA